MKNLGLFLVIAVIASLLNCSGGAETASPAAPGVTDSTIVIGAWGPLTGPVAIWGGTLKGMDAHFKMINEQGGINGRKIKLVLKDDAYDPSRTAPVVREMVQRDEVFAFVGGVGTANGLAVMNYIGGHGIPWVAPLSGSSAWAYPPRKNLFSVYPLYFDEAEVQTIYALDSLRASKIAVFYQKDDFGKSGLISARHTLEKRGLALAAEVSVGVTDSDLSSHAARLKNSGAEVVLLWTTPRQAAIILGTTGAMGYRPQWITSSVLSDMTLMYEITKGAWEGVISAYFGGMPLPTDTTNVAIRQYRAAMARYYPEERWGVFPLAGFFFAEPFVEGLRRVGDDLSREHFIRTMESMENFRTLGGRGPTVSFGPEARQGLRACYLFRCLGPTSAEAVTEPVAATSDPNILLENVKES